MTRRILHCYAKGDEATGWEAICVDLDIAVEARTFDEAKACLNAAIESYVDDALAESPAEARRLLDRRAPIWVRFGAAAAYALHSLIADDRAPLRAGFDLACPA